MGLCNAPATFQRAMNTLFSDMLDQKVVVYLDDILVYSRALDEHIADVRAVLARLAEKKFYCKLKKCAFFARSTTFLGHTIDSNGVHINADKVKSVTEWPIPGNLRAVQQFLGFCNFFRRFIQRYSELAEPLTVLTKKTVAWHWGEEQ